MPFMDAETTIDHNGGLSSNRNTQLTLHLTPQKSDQEMSPKITIDISPTDLFRIMRGEKTTLRVTLAGEKAHFGLRCKCDASTCSGGMSYSQCRNPATHLAETRETHLSENNGNLTLACDEHVKAWSGNYFSKVWKLPHIE